MNQTSITFLALGASILIWTAGTSLTEYLAQAPTREYQKNPHANNSDLGSSSSGRDRGSEEEALKSEIKKLSASLEKNPESEELRLSLANLLFESGIRFSNSAYLKDSVGFFHEIVQKNPQQKDALLGLATLSLHVGASDKAQEYYEKYLEVVPDDLSARSNLALAIARSGKIDAALKVLETVLSKDSKFVIALVTKGLVLKEAGKIDEAIKLFSEAEKHETNPVLIERIQELKESKSVKNESTKDLKSFFSEHPIMGNKLVSTSVDGDTFVVRLKEFPVEHMPEFAKQKLLGSIKSVLTQGEYRKVKILDDQTGKELIVVE